MENEREFFKVRLHRNEIGLMITALSDAIERTHKTAPSYTAYCRLLRKLERKGVTCWNYDDHRHIVPFIRTELSVKPLVPEVEQITTI